MHTISPSQVFHHSSHIQFLTCTQCQLQFHDPNIIIYHSNLVNLVQSTNKLYKNVSHNMRSKIPQTISHNHIKIKGIKIIGQTPRALNFINQFASWHQLVHQTQ